MNTFLALQSSTSELFMKETQKKSWAWKSLYKWYRFPLIWINFNFDILVLYIMYFQNYIVL